VFSVQEDNNLATVDLCVEFCGLFHSLCVCRDELPLHSVTASNEHAYSYIKPRNLRGPFGTFLSHGGEKLLNERRDVIASYFRHPQSERISSSLSAWTTEQCGPRLPVFSGFVFLIDIWAGS
jgi:hypothetical protein